MSKRAHKRAHTKELKDGKDEDGKEKKAKNGKDERTDRGDEAFETFIRHSQMRWNTRGERILLMMTSKSLQENVEKLASFWPKTRPAILNSVADLKQLGTFWRPTNFKKVWSGRLVISQAVFDSDLTADLLLLLIDVLIDLWDTITDLRCHFSGFQPIGKQTQRTRSVKEWKHANKDLLYVRDKILRVRQTGFRGTRVAHRYVTFKEISGADLLGLSLRFQRALHRLPNLKTLALQGSIANVVDIHESRTRHSWTVGKLSICDEAWFNKDSRVMEGLPATVSNIALMPPVVLFGPIPALENMEFLVIPAVSSQYEQAIYQIYVDDRRHRLSGYNTEIAQPQEYPNLRYFINCALQPQTMSFFIKPVGNKLEMVHVESMDFSDDDHIKYLCELATSNTALRIVSTRRCPTYEALMKMEKQCTRMNELRFVTKERLQQTLIELRPQVRDSHNRKGVLLEAVNTTTLVQQRLMDNAEPQVAKFIAKFDIWDSSIGIARMRYHVERLCSGTKSKSTGDPLSTAHKSLVKLGVTLRIELKEEGFSCYFLDDRCRGGFLTRKVSWAWNTKEMEMSNIDRGVRAAVIAVAAATPEDDTSPMRFLNDQTLTLEVPKEVKAKLLELEFVSGFVFTEHAWGKQLSIEHAGAISDKLMAPDFKHVLPGGRLRWHTDNQGTGQPKARKNAHDLRMSILDNDGHLERLMNTRRPLLLNSFDGTSCKCKNHRGELYLCYTCHRPSPVWESTGESEGINWFPTMCRSARHHLVYRNQTLPHNVMEFNYYCDVEDEEYQHPIPNWPPHGELWMTRTITYYLRTGILPSNFEGFKPFFLPDPFFLNPTWQSPKSWPPPARPSQPWEAKAITYLIYIRMQREHSTFTVTCTVRDGREADVSKNWPLFPSKRVAPVYKEKTDVPHSRSEELWITLALAIEQIQVWEKEQRPWRFKDHDRVVINAFDIAGNGVDNPCVAPMFARMAMTIDHFVRFPPDVQESAFCEGNHESDENPDRRLNQRAALLKLCHKCSCETPFWTWCGVCGACQEFYEGDWD